MKNIFIVLGILITSVSLLASSIKDNSKEIFSEDPILQKTYQALLKSSSEYTFRTELNKKFENTSFKIKERTKEYSPTFISIKAKDYEKTTLEVTNSDLKISVSTIYGVDNITGLKAVLDQIPTLIIFEITNGLKVFDTKNKHYFTVTRGTSIFLIRIDIIQIGDYDSGNMAQKYLNTVYPLKKSGQSFQLSPNMVRLPENKMEVDVCPNETGDIHFVLFENALYIGRMKDGKAHDLTGNALILYTNDYNEPSNDSQHKSIEAIFKDNRELGIYYENEEWCSRDMIEMVKQSEQQKEPGRTKKFYIYFKRRGYTHLVRHFYNGYQGVFEQGVPKGTFTYFNSHIEEEVPHLFPTEENKDRVMYQVLSLNQVADLLFPLNEKEKNLFLKMKKLYSKGQIDEYKPKFKQDFFQNFKHNKDEKGYSLVGRTGFISPVYKIGLNTEEKELSFMEISRFDDKSIITFMGCNNSAEIYQKLEALGIPFYSKEISKNSSEILIDLYSGMIEDDGEIFIQIELKNNIISKVVLKKIHPKLKEGDTYSKRIADLTKGYSKNKVITQGKTEALITSNFKSKTKINNINKSLITWTNPSEKIGRYRIPLNELLVDVYIDIKEENGNYYYDTENAQLVSSKLTYTGGLNDRLLPNGFGMMTCKDAEGVEYFVEGNWKAGVLLQDKQLKLYRPKDMSSKSGLIEYSNMDYLEIKPSKLTTTVKGKSVTYTYYMAYPDYPVEKAVGEWNNNQPVGVHEHYIYDNNNWKRKGTVRTHSTYPVLISGVNVFDLPTMQEYFEADTLIMSRHAYISVYGSGDYKGRFQLTKKTREDGGVKTSTLTVPNTKSNSMAFQANRPNSPINTSTYLVIKNNGTEAFTMHLFAKTKNQAYDLIQITLEPGEFNGISISRDFEVVAGRITNQVDKPSYEIAFVVSYGLKN